MKASSRKRPLNNAFKNSQALPSLPTNANAQPAKSAARPSSNLGKHDHSFTRPFAFAAAVSLLVAAGWAMPTSTHDLTARPQPRPTTAAWMNHNGHRPWSTFPTHHLPPPPLNQSHNI
jgi:hypothetical protein